MFTPVDDTPTPVKDVPDYKHLRALPQGDATVVRVLDHVLASGNFEAFFAELCDVVDRFPSALLVIDMRRVTYLHSLAIGAICRLREQLNRDGRRLRLCSLQPRALEVLTATGVVGRFSIWDNEDAALSTDRHSTAA